MKRVPKGWVFRMFPGKFDAIVEGPGYEIARAQQFSNQPLLVEISKVH
jgi:hypothetical protein